MVITSNSKLKLKLLIEKKSQKVLFAEVRKDVVDFLLSLLSLPVGSLTKLITEESTLGPLRNTFLSWEQLCPSLHSSSRMMANSLIPVITPTSSTNFAHLLSSACPATSKEKVYVCNCNSKFSDVPQIFCDNCRKFKKYTELSYVGPGVTKKEVERDGYVKDGVTYFVMDDLSIVHMTPLASFELVSKMGLKDLSLLEEKTVSLDVQQGLELLKTSLRSKNVLTNMFLAKEKEGLAEDADLDMPFSSFDNSLFD